MHMALLLKSILYKRKVQGLFFSSEWLNSRAGKNNKRKGFLALFLHKQVGFDLLLSMRVMLCSFFMHT